MWTSGNPAKNELFWLNKKQHFWSKHSARTESKSLGGVIALCWEHLSKNAHWSGLHIKKGNWLMIKGSNLHRNTKWNHTDDRVVHTFSENEWCRATCNAHREFKLTNGVLCAYDVLKSIIGSLWWQFHSFYFDLRKLALYYLMYLLHSLRWLITLFLFSPTFSK